MSDANTMRAISQDVLGGPEVLKEVELEQPAPRPNEVLVRVRAAGVNPTDWKHRATGGFLGEPPFVLGWDVSGVVEAVGIGVAAFEPGDEVFGMLPYPFGHGAHAEYVTGPARAFAHKPTSIDHTQAGALPLVSLTEGTSVASIAARLAAALSTGPRDGEVIALTSHHETLEEAQASLSPDRVAAE